MGRGSLFSYPKICTYVCEPCWPEEDAWGFYYIDISIEFWWFEHVWAVKNIGALSSTKS